MADSKISALAAVTSLAAADQLAAAVSGASKSIRADHMPGFQLDYVEITSNVVLSATTDGNSQGTAVIDGNSVTYDGSTVIVIEFYVARFGVNVATNTHSGYINLYDGTTDLGRIAQYLPGTTGLTCSIPILARRKLTPSAAAHTYHIRGWKDASGDTVTVVAGAGGASTVMPAYMRITVA